VNDQQSEDNDNFSDVLKYYEQGEEAGRLLTGHGRLEFARTFSILERYLRPPPAVVLDVGGGSGIYAIPLTRQGYQVHLVDAVVLHVEQALKFSSEQP
jgi:2-polyprenyl-3-methyl-5-hydroxy-6-metoxy-1,4-benzoquinol methylase